MYTHTHVRACFPSKNELWSKQEFLLYKLANKTMLTDDADIAIHILYVST